MANYEANQMLVAVKAYTRGNPLSLDASETWESLSEAQTYAKSSIAYAGQTIKAKLEDGKYHQYILQPGDSGYTLEEVGANPSDLKQYVIVGTRPGSGQEEGIIYIDNNVGYIWNGTEWKKIFEDVSASIADYESRIGELETEINLKAPLANPTFTGTVTIEGSQAATQDWVNTLIGQLNNGVPGIVDGTDNPLPSTGYKAGQMWRVAEEGTYAGVECEIGDLIICLKDHADGSAGNSDFMVVQANIDGAVTGADSAVDGHIVVFNGATGKVIKDSNIAIDSLNDAIAKAHEHTNKTQLDTYTKTQEELLSDAHDDAASQIEAVKTTLEESIALKANSADVYTKTDIDGQLSTINQNLNTKVDSTTVDNKINEAKPGILSDAAEAASTALEARIGGIPQESTIKSYIDTAVGSGGADVGEQIEQAKTEAIQTSKEYTDAALTITEF
ncbi:hypothetical protein H9X90_04895 [Faecalicatena contorta]|uniref:hypothetical protein n=1 Tax=Faecalicatena contorta TaxID=39482 RepID=UPI0019603AC8|nr:hypothetical protein [Faecalicatena contorta]MBM6686914.1 hypothetical protein [Faecalicatena contorta]MBM6710088.1 hypothetical protein [Faecalicatena contorta]